jgi:AcrR family transcriptional regulator
MTRARSAPSRLTVEDWIAAAIAIAVDQGVAGIKINRLCERLGVTKGSFYWHFTDLDALLDAVAERYGSGRDVTRRRLLELADVDPHERLVQTLLAFIPHELGRLDSAMRAWAQTDERARAAVASSDSYIFGYLETCFRDMGFDGDAADLRAKSLYYSGIGFSVVGPLGRRGAQRQLRELAEIFSR